jgi:Terpene synthase family 2, C-terminal metal binding
MLPVTVSDDVFSRPGVMENPLQGADLYNKYVAALDGNLDETELSQFAPCRLLADSFVLLARRSPAGSAQRLRQSVLDALASNVEESTQRVTNFHPNLEEYLEIRPANLYGYVSVIVAECAINVDVGEQLAASKDLALARDLTIRHMIFVNDLYSFPKEIAAGENRNAMWIFMHQEHLPYRRLSTNSCGSSLKLRTNSLLSATRSWTVSWAVTPTSVTIFAKSVT